jgi:hypothetical protein
MYHMGHWKQSSPDILAKAGELAAFTGNLQFLVQLLDWTLNRMRKTEQETEPGEGNRTSPNVGKPEKRDWRLRAVVPLFQGALTGAVVAKDLWLLRRVLELLRVTLGTTSELLSAPDRASQLEQLDCRRLMTLSSSLILGEEACSIWTALLQGAKCVPRKLRFWGNERVKGAASLLTGFRFENHALLSIAVSIGWSEGCERLIAEGADPNGECPEDDGLGLYYGVGRLVPVMAAIRTGQLDMLRLLSRHGAMITAIKDTSDRTRAPSFPCPVFVATKLLDLQMVRLLVEEYECDPYGEDYGCCPIDELSRLRVGKEMGLKAYSAVTPEESSKANALFDYLVSRGVRPPNDWLMEWELLKEEDFKAYRNVPLPLDDEEASQLRESGQPSTEDLSDEGMDMHEDMGDTRALRYFERKGWRKR